MASALWSDRTRSQDSSPPTTTQREGLRGDHPKQPQRRKSLNRAAADRLNSIHSELNRTEAASRSCRWPWLVKYLTAKSLFRLPPTRIHRINAAYSHLPVALPA